MASSTIKNANVKHMTLTGTTNAYGSLVFSSELESIYDRICGIVLVNKSEVNVNILRQGNVHFFACWNLTTGVAAANVEMIITVAYI